MGKFFKTAQVSDKSKRITEAGLLRVAYPEMKPDSTQYLYKAKTAKPLLNYIPDNIFTGNPVIDDQTIYEIGDQIQKGNIKKKDDLSNYTSLGWLLPDDLYNQIRYNVLKTKKKHEDYENYYATDEQVEKKEG